MGILHAKTITTYIKTPGGETLSLTRHFLNIDSTRVVYTLQDVPASGPDNSVVTSPQANISTVAHGMVIQIVVTGTAQPQVVAEKAMRDALAAR